MPASSLDQPRNKKDDKSAISGAEAILLILLVVAGMGIWVWVDREFNELFHDREPNEQRLAEQHQVPERQEELTRLDDERKAIQGKLIDARIELVRERATQETLKNVHPDLAKDPPGANAPAETVKAYKDSHLKESLAGRVVEGLTTRLNLVREESRNASARLAEAKDSATREFHQRRALYLFIKPAVTFLATLIIAMLLVALIRVLIPAKARKAMPATQSRLPFLIVIGSLFILLGYQAFEIAGAALVGVALLLIVLTRITWPAQSDQSHTGQ